MGKATGRPQQWAKAAADAEDALQRLLDLQSEYQDWHNTLPENLQEGSTAEKLEAITDLDLESALNTAQEASALDLPLGFGRD